MEMRYEDLLASPDSTCRTLCEFLQIPFEPAMLVLDHVMNDFNPSQPGEFAEHHYRSFETQRIDKWRQFLTPVEVKLIETRCREGWRSLDSADGSAGEAHEYLRYYVRRAGSRSAKRSGASSAGRCQSRAIAPSDRIPPGIHHGSRAAGALSHHQQAGRWWHGARSIAPDRNLKRSVGSQFIWLQATSFGTRTIRSGGAATSSARGRRRSTCSFSGVGSVESTQAADRTQPGKRTRGGILLTVRGRVAEVVVAGAPQRLRDRARSSRLEEPRVPRTQPWRCGGRVLVHRHDRAHTRSAFPAAPCGNPVRTLRPHPRLQAEARHRRRVLAPAVPDCRLHGAETRRLVAGTGVRGVAELTS